MDIIVPADFLDPPSAPTTAFGDGVIGLPRGFVASGQNLPCDSASSAFLRGILIDNPTYNSMSPDQHLALQDPNVRPRWRLYGGPFQTRDLSEEWDRYLYFWAFNQDKTWISHGSVCIAPPWAVPWPNDNGLKWEWIWDTGDRIANRHWDGTKWQITIV